MISFLQFIFNVRVQNRGFWQFMFHRVHFNHDSQNSFSAHYGSWTPKMVNHSFWKISLHPPSPPYHHPPPPFFLLNQLFTYLLFMIPRLCLARHMCQILNNLLGVLCLSCTGLSTKTKMKTLFTTRLRD